MKRKIWRLLLVCLAVVTLAAFFSGCKKTTNDAKEVETTTFGIDVARYQGTIDWQEVADSGVEFAMVRVGYRAQEDGQIKEDVNARFNLQEASKAGIPLGVYFFSTAISEEEAMEEAAWTADLISGYPITYPVVYDCEGFLDQESRQYYMTAEQRTDVALAFLKTIERQGYEGMFYGSKNDLQQNNHWKTSKIEKEYKIWVAQYPEVPYPETPQSSYAGEHQMWQYTTEGKVPGISQDVDLNVAYFGYEGISERRDRNVPDEVKPSIEAMMNFKAVNETVTAKDITNLRDIPSQDEYSQVVATLKNGETAQRVAVCPSGWSKLQYEGKTVYAVSSYLTTDLDYDAEEALQAQAEAQDSDGIETEFDSVNQKVTAKDVVNLRALPSVEHENADILGQLKYGDIAQCTGVSNNGWSRLVYGGKTCYAVSSYLMPADGEKPISREETTKKDSEGIQTPFEAVNDRVTAKVEVNLRSLPSVEDPNCVVVTLLKHGDIAIRTGINRDLGWSRIEYNGQVLYCVSSYLTSAPCDGV